MKNKNFFVTLLIVVFLLVVACLAFFLIKPSTTGKIILDSPYKNTGYGDPTGIFEISPDYISLIPPNQEFNLNLNVIQDGGYIYKIGYFWNVRLGDWVAFELNGDGVEGSYWIADSSITSLTMNASNNLNDGINFIVAYSCIKEPGTWGKWKCGCEDNEDMRCNHWMLQMFNVSNVVWTSVKPNVSCTTASDCLPTQVCRSGICISGPNTNPVNLLCNEFNLTFKEAVDNGDTDVLIKVNGNLAKVAILIATVYRNGTNVGSGSWTDSPGIFSGGAYRVYPAITNVNAPPNSGPPTMIAGDVIKLSAQLSSAYNNQVCNGAEQTIAPIIDTNPCDDFTFTFAQPQGGDKVIQATLSGDTSLISEVYIIANRGVNKIGSGTWSSPNSSLYKSIIISFESGYTALIKDDIIIPKIGLKDNPSEIVECIAETKSVV